MTIISNVPATESLAQLVSGRRPPCLSVYQPSRRRHPENQQDRIGFRNLVRELETSPWQKYPAIEAQSCWSPLKPSLTLMISRNHSLDGLAAFGGPHLFRAAFPPERMPVHTALAAPHRY